MILLQTDFEICFIYNLIYLKYIKINVFVFIFFNLELNICIYKFTCVNNYYFFKKYNNLLFKI